MKRTGIAGALLVPSLLLLTLGGHAPRHTQTDQLASGPVTQVAPTPTAVTATGEASPVVVPSAAAAVGRGFSSSFTNVADTGYSELPSDVVAAYSNAVAVSPVGCRLSVALLAAIGQVESGNLVGHGIDAGHRATPAVVGPVLDGKPYDAVPDTDNGVLDGDKVWDRAVGPMQFLPASWRDVGVDMDGDGLRDPQDVFDAAGGTMVFLCTGDRDLGTTDGLRSAVLSYNHSNAYLRQVLAWKSVFDGSELIGASVPDFGAWAAPFVGSSSDTTPTAMAAPSTSVELKLPKPSALPSSATPTGGPTGTPTTVPTTPATPGTPTSDPTPTTDPTPTADPTPTPDPTPSPEPTPTPTPEPTPVPLPSCPVPSVGDPDVLVDAVTGLPVSAALAAAIPVDPADPDAPRTTDADHPTACLPVIDPVTGLPLTAPLG